MSFGEALQESRSHNALIRLQETEIKLLENIRNCVKLRIKSDQDYAKSLQNIIVQSQKFENHEFTGPTFDVWNKVVKETENLIKQIQKCGESLQKDTFEKLTTMIDDRKISKKSFSNERIRLDNEVKKLQDTVQRQKDEYSRLVGRVREERARYEDCIKKGKPAGKKFDDTKAKYLKAESKLHAAHNDYVLSLRELEHYQRQYLTTLLPGLLNFQEMVQQSNVLQMKEILLDYGKHTDTSSESYTSIHKEIRDQLEKIDPEVEYNSFLETNKSDPLSIDELLFDENLLEDYQGCITPSKLSVTNLSGDMLSRKRTMYHDKLEEVTTDLKEYESQLETTQAEIADLMNTEESLLDKDHLNRNKRLEDVLQRKITELKCSVERYKSLYEYTNTEIEAIGEELPKGLEFPDLGNDTVDNSDAASSSSGSAGIKTTLHRLKNKITKKPGPPPTPLPSKDKLHRNSVAKSEDGDSISDRPPPPLPKEKKPDLPKERKPSESNLQQLNNETENDTSTNHIDIRNSVVNPDGTKICMSTDFTRSVTDEDWFHGVLPREEVQKLLVQNGDYLVRESKHKQTGQMQYVLSMKTKDMPKHFIIQGQEGSWRFEGQSFNTIQELIINQHQSGKPVTSRTQAILERPILREEWELKNDDIKIVKKIGNGNFGDVFKGTFKGQEVAIKTCKETLTEDQKKKFLMEGRILKQYDHPNIVRFIGIATHKQPIMIVMEYVSGGALLNHLRQVGDTLQASVLIKMCEDAASGMAYLEQKSCIHRDLAARNCLLAKPSNTIKISDFGMSREEEVYKVSDGLKQIPIKWTAPEALNYGEYTIMCDVWSYGILMWEIFSAGKTPYTGWNNAKSREMVEEGYRLPNPEGCPEVIYNLMLKCWDYTPETRPHFDQIYRDLQCSRNKLG